jgi:hypothetical protein
MNPLPSPSESRLDRLAPLDWGGGLHVFPVKHGSALFAMAVRQCLWSGKYDSVALAFPEGYATEIAEAVDALPIVEGWVVARDGEPQCYVPMDPCDAYVEGWRQARQRRLPCEGLEDDFRFSRPRHISMPDAQLLPALGVAKYHELAKQMQGDLEPSDPWRRVAILVSQRLRHKMRPGKPVLFLCDYPLLPWLEKIYLHSDSPQPEWDAREEADALEAPVTWSHTRYPIKPEHLYFALGEAPFFSAEVERERQQIFAQPRSYLDLVKTLFLRTREQFVDNAVDRLSITVKAVQQALQYTRNLAALDGALTPGLFDLLTAAKGVFGASFARRLLEAARYYPFFSLDATDYLELGPEKILLPTGDAFPAFNVLADAPKLWRPFNLKPEPDKKKQREYRFQWDSRGLCSHLPEDTRIEKFNRVVRTRAVERDQMAHTRIEKLTSSLKDGIDLRETLRHWHTGSIYVREIPPQTRRVDTIVVLFDETHDERYPHHVTWYAEHPNESTLTFFATDPASKFVGPGIAEAEYGGFSLLFPPRHVPDIFSVPPEVLGTRSLSEQLVVGALLHSREKALAIVSERRPSLRMKLLARRYHKKLVHIPLAQFSMETLKRLRKFHLLNNKHIRTWASRFIDE